MLGSRKLAGLLCVLALIGASAARAELNKTELKCAIKVAKAAGKLADTVAKETAKCRDDNIEGKSAITSCPDDKGEQKIEKRTAKLEKTIDKKCGSVCGASPTLRCLADTHCPPDGDGGDACSGDASNEPFSLADLGFPGAFCESVLGHAINGTEDFSECVATLAERVSERLADAIYGDLTDASGVTQDAVKCLSAASKATGKAVKLIFKSVVKCRQSIEKGKITLDPDDCSTLDEKTAKKVDKAGAKIAKLVGKKCTDGLVGELELCDDTAADLTGATECLQALARETADAQADAAARTYAPISLVETVFPPPAGQCGDGVINQLPHAFLLLGEECDLDDDDACPDACLPPGDLFECSCADVPRAMFVSDGLTSDLDLGWKGFSHNHKISDGTTYVFELTGCDCDAMTGAECTGSSTDPVCEANGRQMPTCSWDLFGSTRCDDHGNGDTLEQDDDCAVCDAFNSNAGTFCEDNGDCQAQCYDDTGTATGPCTSQTDCPAGQRCRGRCDTTQSCVVIPHGPPVATVTAGAGACLRNLWREDATGTQNIVTGENDKFQQRRAVSHFGPSGSPCPVCGGFCDGLDPGSILQGRLCHGTCSGSGDDCRFDSDCPSGETCTTFSVLCGEGFCNLDEVCLGGARDGLPCRVEGRHGLFGTTSSACPPDPGDNFSGEGTTADFLPATSEPVSLTSELVPCTAPAFQLYDCLCPAGSGGIPSRPNLCGYACNAGAELATGCATGSSATGTATTCDGGDNNGKQCDEDADCAPGGGTCSNNPSHCVGDPAFDLTACASNVDCGTGTCVDACPSGRCVPLCVPSAGDPEEGECAVAPSQHRCSGTADAFRVCSAAQANGSCSATCSTAGSACTSDTDCPTGESCQGPCELAGGCEAGNDEVLGTPDDWPGAGICVPRPLSCFVNDAAAEGGDIFNGNGDPTNHLTVSTYCIAPNPSAAANVAAGLGGPGRIRSAGVNITNGFTSLP